MKRATGLRLLALAVPIVGLGLVWRAGQRARSEAEVYTAVVHHLVDLRGQHYKGKVFVSIGEHDPSIPFCQLMSDHRIQVLPGSLYSAAQASPGTQTPRIGIYGIYWHSANKATVVMPSDPSWRVEFLGERWNVSRETELL